MPTPGEDQAPSSPRERIALDTNVAIAVLNGRPGIKRWIESFDTVYLPVPALS